MRSSILCKVVIISSVVYACAQQPNNIKQDYLDETPEEISERMNWWKDAQYGMFIHFGLYSQLGGEWKGRIVGNYAEWIQANANIPSEEYVKLIETFNPKDFDADFIASTAKKAGMKYIVITSKHHEGFCLWDSSYTDFDVASTPFEGRDILAELSVACRKYGLRFGTYYSIIDWNHDTQESGSDGSGGWGNWGQIGMKDNRKGEYVDYMEKQIRELIVNYDTDIIWFDGDWVDWWNVMDGNLMYNYIRNLKPSILINNRVSKRDIFKKDFGTPEQNHPGSTLNYPWEACYTINGSWGFKESDKQWKSPEVIYAKLMDIRNKGGNYLLNIGPDGDGNVPKESVDILLEVGKKLEEN